MATEVAEAGTAPGSAISNEEIHPYRIHVSTRYLNLTRQKLELTRLPHEEPEPKSRHWWQPKSYVEPLIDFWLEQYSWREQEEIMNDHLPQFRTAFSIATIEPPIRIHFIHVRSSHVHAIPLCLIPPFPFSNLSLGHLVKLFTEPEDSSNSQPFHLVIPSLPGLGFSDALPTQTPMISTTAELLDSLMRRLDYPYYLATNAAAGVASPAQIDYKIAEYLAMQYTDSCIGTHLISPPLAQPQIQEAPLEWAKWSIASFFEASILGYREEDFSALRYNGGTPPSKKQPSPAQLGLNRLGLTEPNTLAYALCDSPTGLLVFAMKGLRILAPQRKFTSTEIINFTQLAWLPGPESALRFWAHCLQNAEKARRKPTVKPRVAVTVFLGERPGQTSGEGSEDDEAMIPMLPGIAKKTYSCPSWAKTKYNVLYANRASGEPGLLAWERPELVAAGVRGLAAAVLKADQRLKPVVAPEIAPLEQVVSVPDDDPAQGQAGPETPTQHDQKFLAPPSIAERLHPSREVSDDTKVASDENLVAMAKTPSPMPTPSPVPSPTPTTTA
ncbi:alpha/beta-hydrolase [Xylariaceae sp. FL1019]|nr:alpha/beta-hydrolase [Xylariaceae sp. FL1019]